MFWGLIRSWPHYRNGYSYRHGVDIEIGDLACGISFNRGGRYSNGSHHWSGWFNWRKALLASLDGHADDVP